MPQYWLLKTEPATYSFKNLIQDKSTCWDGVRNYQARNNLKSMQKGDLAFIYHSGAAKEVVGLAEVTREFYPDPSDKTNQWVGIDLKAVKEFKTTIPLSAFRTDEVLKSAPLVKQSRLSVMPLEDSQAKRILKFSDTR